MCSCLLLASASLAASTPGALTEIDVLRAALNGVVLQAQMDAASAQARANGIRPPLFENPSLDARHDQANGPAGALTNSVSASITMDLGLSAVPERQAADLRLSAGDSWRRAETLDAMCWVRRDVLALWLVDEQLVVTQRADDRLLGVAGTLGALAGAGDAAGYDSDRSAIAAVAHHALVDALVTDAVVARAAVAAWAGQPVGHVELAPLETPASLEVSVQGALSLSPVLAALLLERDAAERALVAARRGAAPDLSLYGGRRWDALPDGTQATPGFEVGVGVEVPLFDRGQGDVAHAVAALTAVEAQIVRVEASVRTSVEAAWNRIEALGPGPQSPNTGPVWSGAQVRYLDGEATIDELLQVAADVETAELAHLSGVALRRAAHLDLACSAGAFPEPELQKLLEESLP